MTTITNNKLPEWRTALDKCVENYQSTRAWYEENRDSPAALDDMERAEDQLANFVKKYGFSIVLSLLDEIDDLQELRRSCLALRGEIEDVQAQLYEAENRNNADDEELQERRKADSDPVGEFYEDGPLNWYQISDGDRVPAHRRIPLYRHAQPAPERDQVRSEHAEWSQATFGNVGPVGPLKHLSKEALEAAEQPGDLSEWADMQFLLWDAQRRAGITDEQITQAMIEKLAVNKQREWPEPKDGEPRLHIKEQPTPAMPAELHHDTQNLVADFCTALAEKLYKAQLKYGYDADWKQDGWATQCLSHFHQHIAKGDPRDVAAYCAFMWYHGWKTESVSGPVVPEEITSASAPEIFEIAAEAERLGLRGSYASYAVGWNACRAAMLQGKTSAVRAPKSGEVSCG